MKAITLKQPWAWAVACAGKDIENRTWRTRYRGLVAIHAGLGRDPKWQAFWPARTRKPVEDEYVRGAIIAVAELVDVVEESRSKWFFGPYGILLKNIRPLARPVECKGKLTLWTPDAAIVRRVRAQL